MAFTDQGGPLAGAPPPGAGGGPASVARAAFQRMRPNPPGAGTQASSMMQIASAIKMIQQALMGLSPGSDPHKSALKAVTDLSRHFASSGGPGAEGAEQTMLQDRLRALIQNAMLQRQLQSGQGGGGGGPPQPPTSTPQPGA
jgi:hypothetical protein